MNYNTDRDWRQYLMNYTPNWTWKEYVTHISTPLSSLESLAELNSWVQIDAMEEFPEETDKVVDDILARMRK